MPLFESLPPALFEALGVIGFALYVLSYSLISLHRLDPRGTAYFGMNLAAASLVLVSLTAAFNLASMLIQLFWIAISIAAITLRCRRSGRSALARHPDPVFAGPGLGGVRRV